jgi:hypothetical protein
MLEYRGVVSSDADGIFAVMEEVAPEIPLRLDTPEARKVIFNQVVQCCKSEGSCVAVDNAGRIVGFLLAEPDELERFHHDNQALHLPYGGVAKSMRKQGAFCRLIEMVMSCQVPLRIRPHCHRTSLLFRLAASYRWRHSWQHAIESHAATNGGFIPGGRRSRVLSRSHSGTPDIRTAVRRGRERRRKIVVATRAAGRPFQRAQAIGRRGAGPAFCGYPP